MSDHEHEPGHGHAAVAEQHADPGNGLRFEKEELHFFEADDRGAGQHIGLLLAFIFCILLVLMTAVTLWTNKHKSIGHDPQAIPGSSETTGHH